MKKRGFKPNSRTYTTLLNAYAGIRHSADTLDRRTPRTVEPKTMSRVTIVYDQAKSYMAAKEAEMRDAKNASDPEELGLATDAVVAEDNNASVLDIDINVGPTNAYLKFLARYGMASEMEKVIMAMPTSGPLSPDNITYTTMFSALYDSHKRTTGAEIARLTSSASGLWSRMCRQFQSGQAEEGGQRVMDESVVLIGLKLLARGDPGTQRMMMDVVDSIWSLPRPNVNDDPKPMLRGKGPDLPRLPLTIRAATSIMSVCPKPTDRSHYAQLFLGRPELVRHIDTPFLIAAIRALSETGDIDTVRNILDNYQPRQPNQWPMTVWHDALTAARWRPSPHQGMRSQPDFESAVAIIKQMTSPGEGVADYRSPNGETTDCRGVKWARPQSVDPDAKSLTLLLKIALGRGWREVKQAVEIHSALRSRLRDPNSGTRLGTRNWDAELDKELERARERLSERRE